MASGQGRVGRVFHSCGRGRSTDRRAALASLCAAAPRVAQSSAVPREAAAGAFLQKRS